MLVFLSVNRFPAPSLNFNLSLLPDSSFTGTPEHGISVFVRYRYFLPTNVCGYMELLVSLLCV